MATESTGRRLAAVVARWTGHRVLVVGDAMLDEWRFADSERLCREAPAPVLTLRQRIVAAGGAANTAVNLTALGARATLVAPIGADPAGDELRDCLDLAGVTDRTITEPERRTAVKRRLLAADQILVREDEGDADDVPPDEPMDRLLATIAGAVAEMGVAEAGAELGVAEAGATGGARLRPTLVVCDYGLGALTEPVRAWLTAHRGLFGTVALDAHDLARWNGLAPTVITPSFAEALRLLGGAEGGYDVPAVGGGPIPAGGPAVAGGPGPAGGPIPAGGPAVTGGSPLAGGRALAGGPALAGERRAEFARAHLAELRDRTGAAVAAVTLDAEGAIVGDGTGELCRSHSTPVPASHAVGAGDAYLAAMTLALAAEATLPQATRLAQLAATTTVAETGTCVCGRADLIAALDAAAGGPAAPPPTVTDRAQLAALVAAHRRDGRSVVFTNGCFDVLHRGHVGYLQQARELGDLLVVAVNSDASVRRLKGTDRPVNPVEDRVAVLAALGCVDCVVVFEEDSPAPLIELVRPDVYVKGGDYPPELVPEAPLVRRLGGQVHTLGYVPDRSTSAIIDRIRGQDGTDSASATALR